MSVQVSRSQFLEHVRLIRLCKARRLKATTCSDAWELAYAAQMTFERWVVVELFALGGMAGEW